MPVGATSAHKETGGHLSISFLSNHVVNIFISIRQPLVTGGMKYDFKVET